MLKEPLDISEWLEGAVVRLVEAIEPERVVLFGSFARGTASRQSDIDLFVVWDTALGPLDRMGRVMTLLGDAPRPVEAVVYTPGELERNRPIPFIRRILQEGKTLYDRQAARPEKIRMA